MACKYGETTRKRRGRFLCRKKPKGGSGRALDVVRAGIAKRRAGGSSYGPGCQYGSYRKGSHTVCRKSPKRRRR